VTIEQVVGVMRIGHVRGMKDAPVAEGSTIITYPTFNGAMVGKQALSKEMDTFVAELCNQDLERDQAQEVSPALMATLQEKGYKAALASAVQSGYDRAMKEITRMTREESLVGKCIRRRITTMLVLILNAHTACGMACLRRRCSRMT